MNIKISVVVCTHNRASYLDKALQSLSTQSLEAGRHEIIVIDNGSTDNTREIYEKFSNRTNWSHLYEPIIGLSHARNIGWKKARGKYVAFMDDDAIADPNWLEKYLWRFKDNATKVGCVGGRCLPIWEASRPDWFPDHMLSAFSIYHYADTPVVLNNNQFLTGCNIAFPRDVLQLLGGFREDLGRLGLNLLSNEDVHIRKQLDRLGMPSVYDPEIIVHHHIPASRLTKKWFCERSYWQGVSLARMQLANNHLNRVRKIGLTIKKISWGVLRIIALIFSVSGRKYFRRELQVFETLGYLSVIMGLKTAKSRSVEVNI